MNDQIFRIAPDYIGEAWDDFGVRDIIKTAERYAAGLWTTQSVYRDLVDQTYQLWIVIGDKPQRIKAAIVSQLITLRATEEKELQVIIVAGDHARSWLPLRSVLERYARENGCKRISAVGRKGWARLIDWKPVAVTYAKELSDG